MSINRNIETEKHKFKCECVQCVQWYMEMPSKPLRSLSGYVMDADALSDRDGNLQSM